jgi:hypothetical protein
MGYEATSASRTGRSLNSYPAPTSKERNGFQREATRLLDELAPEKASPRATRASESIEAHRSPNGCILQAENAALTVTWYADASDQDRVGELQIMLWRGVVSRRGGTPVRTPPVIVRQEVLNPIEQPVDESIWKSREGTLYTTPGLAEYCLKLLNTQIGSAKP